MRAPSKFYAPGACYEQKAGILVTETTWDIARREEIFFFVSPRDRWFNKCNLFVF